jgi:predicted DCC family thiol-disulfide oxidoreductase YuxK
MIHPILLYDGVCGLCNRLVQFILRRDPGGVFRFASLQSPLAGRILARHGADASDLDTVYLVVNCDQADEELMPRSDAVIFILRQLGAELRSAGQPPAAAATQSTPTSGSSFWRATGFLLQLVPRRVRDWGYRLVARQRYRIFGRYDACSVPSEETRGRFLDR